MNKTNAVAPNLEQLLTRSDVKSMRGYASILMSPKNVHSKTDRTWAAHLCIGYLSALDDAGKLAPGAHVEIAAEIRELLSRGVATA